MIITVQCWCTVILLDLRHTRTSQRKYRFDYQEQDPIELLDLLKTLPCQVILSGYPSSLYDDLLCGWNSTQLQVMNQGGVRTEKLWFNFAIDRVHWASFAGKKYRSPAHQAQSPTLGEELQSLTPH